MKTQQLGTCTILLNSQGHVLLGKRKNAYKAGWYGLPGGRVEVNEPLLKSAQREVKEETGLDVPNLHYVGVIRENQGDYDFIHFVFSAQIGDMTPQLCEPDKCEGWEWIFDEQLIDLQRSVLAGHFAALTLLKKDTTVLDLVSK